MLRPTTMHFLKFQRALRKINLKAAGTLLIFLMSWISVPAALVAQQSDVCSMECCVAEGHCCCAAPKLWVEGQNHGGIREIGSPEIHASCPCPAMPASGVKTFSRQTMRVLAQEFADETASSPIQWTRPSRYRSLRFTPKSPRAPPSFS
ncbi:MAG: hypothetical protein JST85_23475 [Acidobacteria bacterium]|nr:hypothetical protein [Acidobacteriota bacterium]